jgi:release factor glutamine methyltransferase
MERHVLEHEPREALFVPDDNPLIFYRAIADYAREHLTEGGWLWFEINCRFGMDIKDLLIEKGFVEATLLEDFAGKPRYVKARKT